MTSSSKPLVFTRPYEHLLCGTMELRIKNRKTYYFTPVMDAYSRYILCYALPPYQNDSVVIDVLRLAEQSLNDPSVAHLTVPATVHLSQRGAAKNQAYIDFVNNHPRFLMPEGGFKRSYIMTAFFGRFTVECFDPSYHLLTSYKMLNEVIMDFCKYYNESRIHEALDYQTPKKILHKAFTQLAWEYAQAQAKAKTQAQDEDQQKAQDEDQQKDQD